MFKYLKINLLSILFLLSFSLNLKALESISIISTENILENTISKKAIEDCMELLQKSCNCEVSLNNNQAQILLVLPEISNNEVLKFKQSNFPVYPVESSGYQWTSKKSGSQILLNLSSNSFKGISNGLYGLLQEQLGFHFYHPKNTIIPELNNWPLTENFDWKARAKFDKMGFHLHTMHPLELTEALLDADSENGKKDIKEYIDWLARNQQNYFEFNLLESIDRKIWIDYIKEITNYAKSRGIQIGIDISLNMIQQKAFALYKNFPFSFQSKKEQIKRNIEFLSQANFDYYSVEFSSTEFTPGNRNKRRKLQLYVAELLKSKNAKLLGREHVVQKDRMLSGKKQIELELSEEEEALDKERGLLVHTVMFYSLSDDKAPVYGNKNLKHMLEVFNSESKKRETWYYPESAYWITFDNSVPMTLLPYLSARLSDINLMDSLGAIGHVTFSSGWEWGYWLTDWSIARWCWEHEINETRIQNEALQYASLIIQDDEVSNQLNQLLDLQEKYIKDKELIRYLSPLTFSDELPRNIINIQLQPRPIYTNRYIEKRALPYQLDTICKNAINGLNEFSTDSDNILILMDSSISSLENENAKNISRELYNGLLMTSYRAKHKAQTLSYLVEKREAGIKKIKLTDFSRIDQASKIRDEALLTVKNQEKFYRYPPNTLTEKYKSHTAYNFGYLYTVGNLHYWKREEEQIRKSNYSPFFMNIMNVWKILGIIN